MKQGFTGGVGICTLESCTDQDPTRGPRAEWSPGKGYSRRASTGGKLRLMLLTYQFVCDFRF